MFYFSPIAAGICIAWGHSHQLIREKNKVKKERQNAPSHHSKEHSFAQRIFANQEEGLRYIFQGGPKKKHGKVQNSKQKLLSFMQRKKQTNFNLQSLLYLFLSSHVRKVTLFQVNR